MNLLYSFLASIVVGIILLYFEYRTHMFARHIPGLPEEASGNPPSGALAIIWKAIFGTPERFASSVIVIFAVLSSLVTLLLLRPSDQTLQLMIVRDFIMIVGLMAAVIILQYRIVEHEFKDQSQAQQLDQLHEELSNREQEVTRLQQTVARHQRDLSRPIKYAYDIVHNYRNTIFFHFISVISPKLVQQVTAQDLKLFENICLFITNNLRDSFLQYFKVKEIAIGDDISISVKLVIQTEQLLELYHHFTDSEQQSIRKKDQWIITVFRDPHTYSHNSEREIGGLRVYDIETNTAFRDILKTGEHYFLSNNLRGLAGYHNENPNWESQYNATLVVPVRYRDPNPDRQVSFGLLAVDSLNADGHELFNSEECKHILSHSADLLATFFLSLALFKFNP